MFGAVTCCSGCFSAYRRDAIAPLLERWEHQRFLGRPATYGDDRSLTNYVLRDWRVHYDELARSQTIVPAHFRLFLRQQLRWKRSWTRESLIVGRFIWRKHPLACMWTYLGIVLPLIAPIVAVRAVAWQPLVGGAGAPLVYLSASTRWRSSTASTTGSARALRHAVDLRRGVRLLLPGVPAVADVLRDPDGAQLELGHARQPATAGASVTGSGGGLAARRVPAVAAVSGAALLGGAASSGAEIEPGPDRAPLDRAGRDARAGAARALARRCPLRATRCRCSPTTGSTAGRTTTR